MDKDNEFDFKTIVGIMALYVGLQNLNYNQKQDSYHLPKVLKQHTDLLNRLIQQNETIINQNQKILNLLKGEKYDST